MPANDRFDYKSLPQAVASFLQGQAARIRRQCAGSIISIGKTLIEAKRQLSHGHFVQWVECEVGIPARTAQAYMKAANWAADKGTSASNLPPSAIYLLSAANVSESIVEEIIHKVEAGEEITTSSVRRQLKLAQKDRSKTLAKKGRNQSSIKECPNAKFQERFADEDLSELVVLLSERLSARDFAQVSKTFTNATVLSDVNLAIKLQHEFCAPTCEELNAAKRSIGAGTERIHSDGFEIGILIS